MLFHQQAAVVFGDLRIRITSTFDWFFVITANFLVLFCLGVAFSKLGRVRLGGAAAIPRYGYADWLAMVFAAGVGIGLIWMSTFGGTALDQLFTDGYRGVADSVPELALFRMLEQLPFTEIVSAISVLLIAIFFVTSADSGSLVMDIITAGGKLDAPVQQRAFWCVLAGFVATALMIGGGMASLQALTISIGLPFGLLLLMMCVGLIKGLREG